jgi:hypothetical protein
MANYRKFKVNEVGTDTYIDYEANVSVHFILDEEFLFFSRINEYHAHVLFILVS